MPQTRNKKATAEDMLNIHADIASALQPAVSSGPSAAGTWPAAVHAAAKCCHAALGHLEEP